MEVVWVGLIEVVVVLDLLVLINYFKGYGLFGVLMFGEVDVVVYGFDLL